MKRTVRLTESDLNRLVKRIIKNTGVNNNKRKKINEGFIEFISEYSGLIGTAVAIKLFGKRIFLAIVGGLLKKSFGVKNKSVMKKALNLLIDQPETIYIKYKKIKDYYQLSIELKHYSHDVIFDNNENPFKQINSEDFPISMRVYNDDYVDVRGFGSSDKTKVDGIYGLVESYITNLVSEEDRTLRDQDEYSNIVNIFLKHIKSKGVDDFLRELKSEKINSLVDEISEFTSIDVNIVKECMDNVINEYESVSVKHFTEIIQSFYDNLKYSHNKTLKESLKLTESDLNRLVRRIIGES